MSAGARRARLAATLAPTLAAAATLAACGQKGPLYLPQPPAQAVPAQPAPATAAPADTGAAPPARPDDTQQRKLPAQPDPAAAR